MSKKQDFEELDSSDDDDGDLTTEESADETENETESILVPDLQNDQTSRSIDSFEEDSWEPPTFREQLGIHNTIEELLAIAEDDAESPNEGLQEELREANEKIGLLEGKIESLHHDLLKEKEKFAPLGEQMQNLKTNLSRLEKKNAELEEQNQNLLHNLSRETEALAKAQTDLQVSNNYCAIYESLYKGDKDHNDWVFIGDSLLLTELSGTINPDEPWNELNIGKGKYLCLLGIQLKFDIKPGQPRNKIVTINLGPENGSDGWEKHYGSTEDGYGTRKDIKVQLGIHGSLDKIMNYLTTASIRIKVSAQCYDSEIYIEDGPGFSMDLNQLIQFKNSKSSIAIQGAQGFLQLLFYSPDLQPPVAAVSQLPATGAEVAASNNSGLGFMGVVPVEGADAAQDSVQSSNSELAMAQSSNIVYLHSVPVDNNSEHYALEQSDEAHSIYTVEENLAESPCRVAQHDMSIYPENPTDPAPSHTQLQAHGSNGVAPQQGGSETEKRWPCPECGLELKHASSLSKHKLIHTGEAMVPCPKCEKLLSRGCSLRRHMRKVHKMNIPKANSRPSRNKKCNKPANKSRKTLVARMKKQAKGPV